MWYVGKETTYVLAGVGGRRAQGVSRGACGDACSVALGYHAWRISEVSERRGIVRVRDVQRGAEGTRAGAQVGEGRSLGLCYCIVAVWRHGTRAAARFLSRSVLLKSRIGMSGWELDRAMRVVARGSGDQKGRPKAFEGGVVRKRWCRPLFFASMWAHEKP